jgi:hypothetical protein
MERMLKNGTITNINIQYPGDGSTALMYQAGCYGTKAAMEWLLNRQPPADVHIISKSKSALLIAAVYASDPEKYLSMGQNVT